MQLHRNRKQMTVDVPDFDPPTFADRHFVITQYGAVGDGIHSNTDAFAQAIEDCAAAGGGTVVVPSGVWVTGPIELRSNVCLHVEKGALVTFSRNHEEYRLVHSNFEGSKAIRAMSPLYGDNIENVGITGEGLFDGSGDAWRFVKKMKMTRSQWKALVASGGVTDETDQTWWPTRGAWEGRTRVPELLAAGVTDLAAYEPYRVFLRPTLLSLTNCRHVLLDGPTFQNSPGWCLHPRLCEYVTVRNIHVRNPWYSQNGDGLDIESCRFVHVESSTFDVGDDAICMKSGKDEQGRRLGKPTAHVRVRDCTVFHGHGGFVVGSEMSGGVHDIDIADCTFIGTDVGLRFKSTRGRGGVVERIAIRNIRMKNIAREAILFDLFYAQNTKENKIVPVSKETPCFRDVSINGVVCTGAEQAVSITGLPEMPVEHVRLQHVRMHTNRGFAAQYARHCMLDDCQFVSNDKIPIHIADCQHVHISDEGNESSAKHVVHVSGTDCADIRYNNESLSSIV